MSGFNFEKLEFIKSIGRRADAIFPLCGFLLGCFVIYMSLSYRIHQQDIGGTILFASLTYILLKEKLLKGNEIFQLQVPKWSAYVNNIFFFFVFSFSLWILYTNLYIRPLSYFILTAFACVSITFDILHSNEKLSGFVLFKILIIGLLLYGGIYYEFSDIYGTDTHFHNGETSIYIERGHIVLDAPQGYFNSYYYFPIFHILTSVTSILTGLNVYDSIFSSITFPYTFSVVFIFLIGKKLVNSKVGLLAALILVFGDYRILFGAAPIPTSFGSVFFMEILYLFLVNASKPIYNKFIVIFLLVVLVLTHTIAAFIMFVTIISLYFWKKIKSYLEGFNSTDSKIFLNTIVMFGAMLIGYWLYAISVPERSSATFLDYILSSLYHALTYDAEFATSVTEKVSPYVATSYSEYFLDHLGYLFFLGTGIIGTYVWLMDENVYKSSLSLTIVVLFALLYGFSLMGMRTIMPSRWFIFVYGILALVSASGIFRMANLIENKLNIVTILTIIFLMSFFMVTSTISNGDNPLYNEKSSQRLGHKASEINGIETIGRIYNGTINPIDLNMVSLGYSFIEDRGKLYVLNKEAFRIPVVSKKINPGIINSVILDDSFKARFESNGSKIYNNGEIWGYLFNSNN
ncbi:hypothetical protein MSSIT_3780 [Methanosarcina siciliae T4/M]|uniref:Glycosyltransferase RgtA/B/C/D-like domain-containing protein n=1 Tax=Methanosarcina siciliae T4/M TaxID=1434120 RepID=A0A0E3P917_9EURY|nr:hypothetical protein [Methanosarcina siciliae]AKB30499.1 hypothetical protein MSSIT_3780 [Methanosarcina siciliae T4/M]